MRESGLSPPQRLAVAYAPAVLRPTFSLLLEIDARLADTVAKSRELLIGQLKLAWWRDAIAAGVGARPKGEPLLARLDTMPANELEPALSQLVDAWEIMLVGGEVDMFAEQRGLAVFSRYADWANSTVDVGALGVAWAMNSVGIRTGATLLPTDRDLRPLGILALSVREVSGPRLLWHALTGR